MSPTSAKQNAGTAPLLDRLLTQVPHIPLTWYLISVNLLVFVAMLLHGAGLWHSPNQVQLAWGASFGPATKEGEWWRLGSALFLHFGLLHLATNMFALWECGYFVERMYGWPGFLVIYILSGLVGNVLSLLVQGDHAVSGGASGAIFGVYGALLVYLWSVRRQLSKHEFHWLFWGAMVFSAMSVGMGFAIPGIDNAAHIGGLVSGLLMACVLLPSACKPGAVLRLTGAAATATWVLLMVLAIPAPTYRWSEEQQARSEIRQFIGEERQISAEWESILAQGRANNSTFEQLAGQLETEVADKYDHTFEQLSALHLSPDAPSAQALDALRRYAELRRDASKSLVQGLRQHDRQKIIDSLDRARRAPTILEKPAATSPTRAESKKTPP